MSGIGGLGGQGGAVEVAFSRTILVGPGNVGVRDSFATLAEALTHIKGLPPAQQPSDLSRIKIVLGVGTILEESGFIPDFVHIVGEGQFICGMQGEDVANNFILSIGIGAAQEMAIFSGTRSTTPLFGLWSRRTESLYIHQEDVSFPIAGGTLDLSGIGVSETVNVPASADWATFVSNMVALGTNVDFIDRFFGNAGEGVLELRNRTNATRTITVDSTGTANAQLGFSTTVDTSPNSAGQEVIKTDNVAVSGSGGAGWNASGAGVAVDDFSVSSKLGRLFIGAVPLAVAFSDWWEDIPGKVQSFLFESILIFNTKGVYAGQGRLVNVANSNLANTTDFDPHVNGVIAAVSTPYRTRTIRQGPVIPAGGRITYTWKLTGNIVLIDGFDGEDVLPFDFTIESITVWRGVAGGAASTIVDIERAVGAGAFQSLWTTPADRPTITAAGGNNQVVSPLDPETYQLDQFDRIRASIKAAESGPAGQNVTVTVVGVIKV